MRSPTSLLVLVLVSGVPLSIAGSADWSYWGSNENYLRLHGDLNAEDFVLLLHPKEIKHVEKICKLKCVFYSRPLDRVKEIILTCHTEAMCTKYNIRRPDHWPDACLTGKRQSPINIISDDTVKTDLGSLKFVRYDYAYTATLTNTGHSVQITLTGVPMFLKGGGLSSTYVFDQMHFHWGAEHTIDGTRDALELHMVHYAKQYPNFTTAAQNDYGLSVVAVLFKLSDEDNDDIWSILEATERVSAWVGTSSTQVQRRIIPSLLLPKDYTTFYRYDGSLTTPGCSEVVTWFVLTEKLAISHSQLKVFENVMSNNGTLKFNYRPVQELGYRDVYHRLVDYSGASISIENKISLTTLAVIFSLLLLVR